MSKGSKPAVGSKADKDSIGWEPPAYMSPADLEAKMEQLKTDGNQSDGKGTFRKISGIFRAFFGHFSGMFRDLGRFEEILKEN